MKRKLKDLAPSDFPGVNPRKFEEWKNLNSQANTALFLGMLVWGTGLITVPLIGGAIGWSLPIVFWFGYMFAYSIPLTNREKRLAKTIGIDAAAIKKALSK
jgi:hypothetical protein